MKIESSVDIKICIELDQTEAELLQGLVQNPVPDCSSDVEDFCAELFNTLRKHTEKVG